MAELPAKWGLGFFCFRLSRSGELLQWGDAAVAGHLYPPGFMWRLIGPVCLHRFATVCGRGEEGMGAAYCVVRAELDGEVAVSSRLNLYQVAVVLP